MRKFWSIWFLVATTLFISSCAGFKSIRHSKVISPQNQHSKSEIINDEEDLTELEPIQSIEKDSALTSINDESNNYAQLANIVSNRIPTLREQMQLLSETQDNMKKDLSDVKSDVEEIKTLIADLKSTIDTYIPAGTRLPATGADNRMPDNNRISSNSNMLLSDENLSNSTNTISNRAISETYLQSDEKVANKAKPVVKPKIQIKNDTKQEKATSTINDYEIDNKQYDIGKEYLAKQQYANAIESFKNALSAVTSKKKEAEIEYLIGESYYFLADYDKSIEFMNKVLSAKESSLQDGAILRKAEANLKSGKVSDAKAEYQALIRNHPSSNYVPQARKMLQQL